MNCFINERIKTGLLFALLLILLSGCYKKNKTITENPDKKINSVCIWDNIGVRKEPVKKSPVISKLNLGDEIISTGIEKTDSTFHNQIYFQILLDGNKFWIPKMALALNAVPAVVKENSGIFLRPDLLTKTDKEVSVMEIIAVMEKQENWIKFMNEKNIISGWIESDKISFDKEEIAFALFANRKLKEKSDEPLINRINFILENNTNENSLFVNVLQNIKDKETEKQSINEIMINN